MLTQAAERENDPTRRAQYLRDAADAYLKMGQHRKSWQGTADSQSMRILEKRTTTLSS